MNDWTRSSKYSIDHSSGRWRISATRHVGEMKYTLWEKASGCWAAVDVFPDPEAPKAHVMRVEIGE